MDHFQVRGWRCIQRHYYLTALSFLFCSRTRQRLDGNHTRDVTVEQVRRAENAYLKHHRLPPALRDEAFEKELTSQRYHQERNAQAKKSHTKTRTQFYHDLGIDVDTIKSCVV